MKRTRKIVIVTVCGIVLLVFFIWALFGIHLLYTDRPLLRMIGRPALRIRGFVGGVDHKDLLELFDFTTRNTEEYERRDISFTIKNVWKGLSQDEQDSFLKTLEESFLESSVGDWGSYDNMSWVALFWEEEVSTDFIRKACISSDSGTGNFVLMVLNLVFTFGTLTGSRLYFAISIIWINHIW